ncbi:hypothetical protein LTR84_000372 [Exophiala bonariae]|uniref:Heterokaryon incompatibility domain-containing protein n=1 Tax=Exophiala bonariae TaxID=1690606 RepID=A0AAV9NQE3_9EURO|nr:hypothetical protein LTR84_000372 [Exophiala bonariae]
MRAVKRVVPPSLNNRFARPSRRRFSLTHPIRSQRHHEATQSACSTTSLYGQQLWPQEIRLLLLQPAANPDTPIVAKLERTSLTSGMKYAALSYTWGTPFASDAPVDDETMASYENDRHHYLIDLNGIEFPVGRNLAEGLRRLRHATEQRALWVDALCINQQDQEERGLQVRYMGRIYQQAELVCVWLGEGLNDLPSRPAMALIEGILDSFKHWYGTEKFEKRWGETSEKALLTCDSIDQRMFWEWLHEKNARQWVQRDDLHLHLGTAFSPAWKALDDLLSRTWWDRAWTWQEKELARSIKIYLGDLELSWRKLRFAMLLVMAHDQAHGRGQKDQLMPNRRYLHIVDNISIERNSPTFLDMAINIRHRECRDPADKIFGLLGAVQQEADSSSSHINARIARYQEFSNFSGMIRYGEKVATVPRLYTEFARYHIQDMRDLRALQACNPRKKGRHPELPSWVADWSDTSNSYELSSYIYDAAGNTTVDVTYDPTNRQMSLRGTFVDTVSTVYRDATIDALEDAAHEDKVDDNLQNWQRAVTDYYGTIYLRDIKNSRSDPGQGLLAKTVYEPTGESLGEAYWRTLLVNKRPGTKMDADRRIKPQELVEDIFHGEVLKRMGGGALTAPTRSYVPGWLGALHRTVLRNRFFTTGRGLFGLAPANLREGDVVVVLDGGNVPFLLRKRDDHYQLVEEAYVHGFMHGAAIKERRSDASLERVFHLR